MYTIQGPASMYQLPHLTHIQHIYEMQNPITPTGVSSSDIRYDMQTYLLAVIHYSFILIWIFIMSHFNIYIQYFSNVFALRYLKNNQTIFFTLL